MTECATFWELPLLRACCSSVLATPCRADACFGGGNHTYKQDVFHAASWGSSTTGIGLARDERLAGGLLAASAVAAVWLSARRLFG